MRVNRVLFLIAPALLAGVISSPVLGNGFAISGRSVSAQGQAYAGAAALAEDASALYNNPALLTELQCDHLSAGVHYHAIYMDYRDSASNSGGTPHVGV